MNRLPFWVCCYYYNADDVGLPLDLSVQVRDRHSKAHTLGCFLGVGEHMDQEEMEKGKPMGPSATPADRGREDITRLALIEFNSQFMFTLSSAAALFTVGHCIVCVDPKDQAEM